MVVHVNKRKEGVVGLSGDPREIMPVAKIVKMSVELMLEYESYKFESLRKYNLKEQLVHLILYLSLIHIFLRIRQAFWGRQENSFMFM